MKGQLLLALLATVLLVAGCAGQPFPTGISQTGTPTTTASATQAVATTAVETPPASPIVPAGTSTPSSSSTPVTLPPSPTSSSQRVPTSNSPANSGPAELKYRLIAEFGNPFFCDPDYYPVGRELSEAEFQRRFAAIQADTQVYQTILLHLGLNGQAALSPQQERLVYAEYKKLYAINLQPAGEGYQFSLRIPAEQRQGTAVEGLIDTSGAITVTKKLPSFNVCPICLASNTLIATPTGEIRVQELQKGMPVWTSDATGARRPAVILETTKRELPAAVGLLDLLLQDGRELVVSAGHPLTDGRIVGDLAVGDFVDGARVKSVETLPYQGGATYDLLPSGETGFYWANGILVKSTLAP